MTKQDVKDQINELFDCDNVRIISPVETFYVIIGKRKSTGQWLENGNPVDFEYLDETIVGKGETLEELLNSAKEHKKLSEMSMEEFLRKELLEEKNQHYQAN